MSHWFGFLNVDKPAGISSRDAVNRVQRFVRPAKVGHCGTLDPLATGVLVIGLGPATRLTPFVQDLPKTYIGQFRLGISSPTDDLEGTLTEVAAPIVEAQQLQAELPRFTGTIEQTPPEFSAVKIAGKRAYELARKGKDVQLKPRQVTIWELELTEFEYPDFTLRIHCGSGTYIRSLGRDLGRAVGSAAVMTSLRRTAIGDFEIESAIGVDSLTSEQIAEALLPAQTGLPCLPRRVLDAEQLKVLEFGSTLELEVDNSADQVAVVDQHDRLWAVMQRRGETTFSPKWNFWKQWREASAD